MTSAATVCGHFPLTLVTGAGAAARNSIGITVVAGMAMGTIFTLLVIPSIYVLIAKQHAGEEIRSSQADFDDLSETAESSGGSREFVSLAK
jgi:multidrug efflux pump